VGGFPEDVSGGRSRARAEKPGGVLLAEVLETFEGTNIAMDDTIPKDDVLPDIQVRPDDNVMRLLPGCQCVVCVYVFALVTSRLQAA
jgi:hypothetical protein